MATLFTCVEMAANGFFSRHAETPAAQHLNLLFSARIQGLLRQLPALSAEVMLFTNAEKRCVRATRHIYVISTLAFQSGHLLTADVK